MGRFATVIPDNVCSAVFWEEGAETGDGAPSPAVCHMMYLRTGK